MSIVDGQLTSVTMCWRLERSDGAGLALTSHDQPVHSGGISYDPEPGITPAAVSRSLGLEPHSGEVAGAVSSDALNPVDLAVGRWDAARVCLTAVDWRDENAAAIPLICGEIGSVSINGDGFSADLRGAAAKLDDPVCLSTSAECRA